MITKSRLRTKKRPSEPPKRTKVRRRRRAKASSSAYVETELPSDLSGAQFQQEIFREAIRNMRRGERDPDVTPREKAALASSATQAARALAKLRGEFEVTGAQILRSRKFGEIMTAI